MVKKFSIFLFLVIIFSSYMCQNLKTEVKKQNELSNKLLILFKSLQNDFTKNASSPDSGRYFRFSESSITKELSFNLSFIELYYNPVISDTLNTARVSIMANNKYNLKDILLNYTYQKISLKEESGELPGWGVYNISILVKYFKNKRIENRNGIVQFNISLKGATVLKLYYFIE